MDQRWVIDMARSRQEFICQGQSVNVFFPAGTDKEYFNAVHLRAFSWKGDFRPLKGLYYLRTNSGAAAEKVSQKVEAFALSDEIKNRFKGYDFSYHTKHLKQISEPDKIINRNITCSSSKT